MKTITIDQAGRLVIPKDVRSKLHIHEGDRLEVEVGYDSVTLRPLRKSAAGLTAHEGRMVWDAAGMEPDLDVFDSALRRGREERDNRVRET